MQKTDAFAAGMFILLVVILVALAACAVTGNLDVFVAAAAAVVIAIVIIGIIVYVCGGVYYMFKKKDKVDSETAAANSMSLGDVQEVEGSMEANDDRPKKEPVVVDTGNGKKSDDGSDLNFKSH